MNASEAIRTTEQRGGLQSYVIGALLALVLTLSPFAAVMGGVSGTKAVAVIIGLAVIQIVVHLVFFLHLGRSPDQSWNLTAFLFAALILGILVGGSYWVMYHLDQNMMPAMQMGALVESNLVAT
jgi:cytochrome o ubiquinol oxidase subunit IV